MPRQARLDDPGTLYHVIVRGMEKRRIIDDKVDRDNFVSHMGQVVQGLFSEKVLKTSTIESGPSPGETSDGGFLQGLLAGSFL